MKNFKKINSILNFVYLGIFIIIIGCLILSPLSFRQVALALSGNYNRTTSSNSIGIQDWNWIRDDFLAKDGDSIVNNSMTGDLNMGGHRIINATTSSASPNDAATVQFVNNAISSAASAGGGDVYTNWGSAGCGTDDLMYSGFAFSARYDNTSGSSNPICIQSFSYSLPATASFGDNLYPVVTGDSINLPSSITGGRAVRCALCHVTSGTCYVHYGTNSCGTGFNVKYSGYVLGSYGSNGASTGFYNPTQRACVNSGFDSTASVGTNMGAMWYGARIQNTFSLGGYTPGSFIRCSVCCN